MKRTTLWVVVYAIAMAFVEAAVVVYLRQILAPGDPTVSTPTTGVSAIPVVEAFREAATIVMLLAVGVLAGGDTWERFLWFSCAFGIWDIFYYVWLRVLIGWPVSVFSWDVLFLIPVPWTAPVLAPVIISLGLVVGSQDEGEGVLAGRVCSLLPPRLRCPGSALPPARLVKRWSYPARRQTRRAARNPH